MNQTTAHPDTSMLRLARWLSHYALKRRHYGVEHPHFYDRDMRRLFSDGPDHARNIKAARFVARVRKDVRRTVSQWTGEY
jgi:hypothetical protein